MIPKIAIRVDGSAQIGTGHVQRCLSLADSLRRGGADIIFVTRSDGGSVAALINQYGFLHLELAAGSADFVPETAAPAHANWAGISWQEDASAFIAAVGSTTVDWVIVDHYAFDSFWHAAVRAGLGARIAVIDDLGDRKLAADLVIDHNPVENPAVKYAASLDSVGKFLTGSRFALLGAAYADSHRRTINQKVDSIGIFMGGGRCRQSVDVGARGLPGSGLRGGDHGRFDFGKSQS